MKDAESQMPAHDPSKIQVPELGSGSGSMCTATPVATWNHCAKYNRD